MTESELNLRIICLIPSATDICVALNLQEFLVGVTHECDRSKLKNAIVLTADGVNAAASSQGEIHAQVQAQIDKVQAVSDPSSVPSLYPILDEQFQQAMNALNEAKTRVIITQDLCKVCAPSTESVKSMISELNGITMLSLTPHTLLDVADNIRVVANACGVTQRGKRVYDEFVQNLQTLSTTILDTREGKTPTMFALEWLDPPFDGGHWVPQQMEFAGVMPAIRKDGVKSVATTWEAIQQANPDVVLVACCGMDLLRNVRDALVHRDELLRFQKLFAVDGDKYFARPGPRLLVGAIIMALIAYQDQPQVIRAIQALPFVPDNIVAGYQELQLANEKPVTEIGDLEDFVLLHRAVCQRGELTYKDPSTGYSVFTELAHKRRGTCCGSGCRHCPYNHENVKDKAMKIQQPAVMVRGEKDGIFALKHGSIRVLFSSGGKDSFLTIRALAREAQKVPFGLVLLTTFDATSRVIAHQDMPIEHVVRQAKHLGITLVGVPMHRGSSEGYIVRVRKGLTLVEKEAGGPITSLVFGDLHLEHVIAWREDQLGPLGYKLTYPLWNVDYKHLIQELEDSKVSIVVTASETDKVAVGDTFDHNLLAKLEGSGIDMFGENGEFHSCAQVWLTDRQVALGLECSS